MLGKYIAVVDGSFFLEHLEYISAHWKFIHRKKIIGQGQVIAKVDPHLQSAYAAEACGRLGVLAEIKGILRSKKEVRCFYIRVGLLKCHSQNQLDSNNCIMQC